MATFTKFHAFVEAVAEGVHGNLATADLRVYLTNTAPNPATHAVKADLTEISAGNGYTAGGNQASQTSSAQVSGVYTLVLADPATWTATGAIGPFQHAVLYNNTAANKNLIGAWSEASVVNLAVNDTYKVNLADAGIITLQ